jgi:hypothetical protein
VKIYFLKTAKIMSLIMRNHKGRAASDVAQNINQVFGWGSLELW